MPAAETTSSNIATLAARIIGMSDALIRGLAFRDPGAIRAVAASALTQAADRAKYQARATPNAKPKRKAKTKPDAP